MTNVQHIAPPTKLSFQIGNQQSGYGHTDGLRRWLSMKDCYSRSVLMIRAMNWSMSPLWLPTRFPGAARHIFLRCFDRKIISTSGHHGKHSTPQRHQHNHRRNKKKTNMPRVIISTGARFNWLLVVCFGFCCHLGDKSVGATIKRDYRSPGTPWLNQSSHQKGRAKLPAHFPSPGPSPPPLPPSPPPPHSALLPSYLVSNNKVLVEYLKRTPIFYLLRLRRACHQRDRLLQYNTIWRRVKRKRNWRVTDILQVVQKDVACRGSDVLPADFRRQLSAVVTGSPLQLGQLESSRIIRVLAARSVELFISRRVPAMFGSGSSVRCVRFPS